MSDTEFDIIRRYFTRQLSNRNDVITGIGDDAALLQVPAGMELVVCMDTLVEGVHFPVETPAAAIGHKALAVNLSDLAAMGAEPAWVTLAITLPEADAEWLAGFSQAFFKLADRYKVQLVGGDTTQGPLSITVQAHGFVPQPDLPCRCTVMPTGRYNSDWTFLNHGYQPGRPCAALPVQPLIYRTACLPTWVIYWKATSWVQP